LAVEDFYFSMYGKTAKSVAYMENTFLQKEKKRQKQAGTPGRQLIDQENSEEVGSGGG
jgi:hypothetical protein